MSEKLLKLKLKRKKSAIQVDKCEQNSSIAVKKGTGEPIPFSSFERDLRSETTGDPFDSKPGVWWDRSDLQAVEKLWAVVLRSAIPNLGHSVWEMVPDLPLASPVTCSVEEQTGWTGCSLSEEVGPLPSPPKPPASSSAILGGRGPDHRLRPTDAGLDSEGAWTPLSSGLEAGRPSPAPTQDEAGEGPSGPGSPGRGQNWTVGRASLEGAGSGTEGGVAQRRLTDSSTPEEQHGRARPPVGEGGVSGSAPTCQNSDGGGAAAMETCPMCLQPFPSGSTQMECDSHLAKCLSEMSEDIAW